MAFVNPAIDESEQNKFGGTGVTTPNPQDEAPPESGSTGAGASGTGAGAAPTQATSTQFGSSASKLSDYLSANAPQVESMGSSISGELGTQYGKLQGDINKAGSDFGSAVQGGYTPANQELVNQAASNPAEFAKDPNNISNFQKQLNNSYTGPQNFEGFEPYGKVQGDVASAVQGAGLLNSTGGLSSYLQNKAQGTYTPGMNTLDTTLLQASPNASKMVKDATKPYEGLTDYLNQTAQNSNKLVDPAKQAAAQTGQYARDQFAPVTQQFQQGLTSNAANQEANRLAYNTSSNSNQSAAQAQRAALLQAQQDAIHKYTGNVNNLAGPNAAAQNARIGNMIDPTSYLSSLDPYLTGNQITNPATIANTANAGQYQEDAALSQLLGSGYTPTLDQANVGQAGTYQAPTAMGALPDTSGQTQYMGDIASLYGNAGLANIAPSTGLWNATPAQLAQIGLNKGPNQGFNLDDIQRQALQRIIANQYAGRT